MLRRGGGAAITGTYAGYTYDSYIVFEVHADGSVTGTVELIDYGPDWPDSYLAEYLLWAALDGFAGSKGVTLELEYHYDFPDGDSGLYYTPEDDYQTLQLRAGTDADGQPVLTHNAGWGVKFVFTRQS